MQQTQQPQWAHPQQQQLPSNLPTPTQLSSGGIAPGKHHMHPAYVILNAARIVFSLFILAFFGMLSSGSAIFFYDSLDLNNLAAGGVIFTIIIFVLAAAVTVIVSYIYYRRFLWEITDSDIHIYSGIFFKKQVHIPFLRVQSIDFNAPLIERILGIVKLKIDTAGGAHNRGVMIPALKLAEADALRAEVFARKRYTSAQEDAALKQKMQAAKAAMPGQAFGAGAAAVGAAAVGVMQPGVATSYMQADAVPRFDPQTGQPLQPPYPQPQAMSQFDPQTGQPLAFSSPTSADKFVDEVGASIGGLRVIFADAYQEDAVVEYEYGLSAKELIFSAISGDHNLILSAVFIFVSIIIGLASQAAGIDNAASGFYSPDELGSLFASQAIPVIIGFTILFLVFIIVMGVVGTAVSYGGFKACRRGGRIEVERGLVSRQYKGVAINRVQSIEINQGFIRRLLGYVELKLLTIDSLSANQNQQNSQNLQQNRGLVIHPFVKKDCIEEILTQLIPEFNGRPVASELRGLPKVALRRVINRHTVFFGLVYAAVALVVTLIVSIGGANDIPEQVITWLMVVLWGLFILLLVGRLVASILWYRQASYTYNTTTLMIHQGFFSLTTTIIPRKKIQWAQLRQNPFQRFSKVASITAVTAAGIGGTKTRLRDLSHEEATAYLAWIRPRK